MTNHLRTIAEAKSQIAFPVPELHMLKEVRKERRIGYVEGFIAGRTSVSQTDVSVVAFEVIRELIPVSQPMADKASVLIARRVLAQLRGETNDD